MTEGRKEKGGVKINQKKSNKGLQRSSRKINVLTPYFIYGKIVLD